MKNPLKKMGVGHWGSFKEIARNDMPSRADPGLLKLDLGRINSFMTVQSQY